MRLTLESTNSEPQFSLKATVEVPHDDLIVNEVYELVDQLLRGYGFYISLRDDDAD